MNALYIDILRLMKPEIQCHVKSHSVKMESHKRYNTERDAIRRSAFVVIQKEEKQCQMVLGMFCQLGPGLMDIFPVV